MKMQRLHLLAMEEERQSLMDALLQFGRLEIRQTEDLAALEGVGPLWARHVRQGLDRLGPA